MVQGDLGSLRSSGGDFTSATEDCLADNLPARELPYSGGPGPGQVGDRNLEIDAAAASCP